MSAAPELRTVVPGVAAPTDRRYRRSELRPDRRRLGRRLVRVVGWTALGLAITAGLGWATEWALRADALRVQDVEVHGNTRLSAAEIEKLVDGLRGENILEVDFEAYRRRLLDSPWIAGATFRRALPATIAIEVVERTPLAVARLGQQLYLVDDNGVVIDEYGASYADLDLPIADGLLGTHDGNGSLVDPVRARLVHALLTALIARPELPGRLSQIDVSNPHDVVVMFDAYPMWLHLGETRFLERLQTFLEIVPALQERVGEVDHVDLRFDDRVFVRPRSSGRAVRPSAKSSGSTVERPSGGRHDE